MQIALENNASLKASHQRVQRAEELEGTAWDLEKTEVYFNYDENNVALNFLPLNTIGVSQSIEFPAVYSARKKVLKGERKLAQDQLAIDRITLERETRKAYHEVVYWKEIHGTYEFLDSVFRRLSEIESKWTEEEGLDDLEKLNAEAKREEIRVRLKQTQLSVQQAYAELRAWMQTDSVFTVSDSTLDRLGQPQPDSIGIPGLQLRQDMVRLSEAMLTQRKRELWPDLNLGVFEGINSGDGKQAYTGVQVGVGLPLAFGAQRSRISAARKTQEIARSEQEDYRVRVKAAYLAKVIELQSYQVELNYFDSTGRELATEIIKESTSAFEAGEIDLLQYFLYIESSREMVRSYLASLRAYNRAVLELRYFTL